MAVNFDKVLNTYEQGLQFRAKRAEVIAGNIANADTPGYQAKDLSFKEVLQQQSGQNAGLPLSKTQSNHLSLEAGGFEGATTFTRQAMQPSENGNTVELGQEQAAFARNRMEYETSYTFLNMKLKGLEQAINSK